MLIISKYKTQQLFIFNDFKELVHAYFLSRFMATDTSKCYTTEC